MPCDSIRRGDYVAEQARKRALSKLADKLGDATVETEATDYAGNTAFRAVTLDGYILSGTLNALGEFEGVRIEGWALEERAGWCDECSMAALRGSSQLERLKREIQQGAGGLDTFSRNATILKR